MIKKVDSFKTVQKPKSNTNPSIDIILVHGFKSSKLSGPRDYLENWLKNATRKHSKPTARASVFAFKEADVLSKGVDELQRTSDKLLEKIRSLNTPVKTSRRKRKRDDQATRFLLIAHSFGAWVVRNGLARYDNLDLSSATLGIIFLDNPKEELGAAISSRSKITIPKKETMAELEDRLDEVQRNWDNIGVPKYGQYVKRYKVWNIESKMDVTSKSNLPIGRLGRMMRPSDQCSDSPIGEDELGKVFDQIISVASSGSSEPVDNQTGTSLTYPAELISVTNTMEADPRIGQHDALPRPAGLIIPISTSTPSKDLDNPAPPEFKPVMPWRSIVTTRETLSHRGSIVSSINDDQSVSKLSTNALSLPEGEIDDFLKIFNLARQYLQRGDLDNAYILYQRCETILKRFRAENTIQNVQVRMQMAITILQKGRYREARQQLEVLREFFHSKICIIENTDLKYKIESELELWFATCLIRQGQYRQAKVELERLMKREELIPTDLSDEKLILAKAKARRLLALANAYLGDYEEAFEQVEFVKASIASLDNGKRKPARANLESPETPVSQQSSRILACQYNFQFTEAIIRLLWGDYVEGVKKAKSAHEGFVNQWGQKHIRSLEVTSLYALALAYNSDAGNAATLCQRTMETMTKVLGDQHPLTLQNMDVLVFIFRTQSRFTEAVDTSNSLCKKVEAALGGAHPQTLRSKCQLGVAKLSCGDYKAAEKTLEAVTKTSRSIFGADHPDTLRFQSELAQAYCLSWKLKLAEDLALEVLSQQRFIYTIGKRKNLSGRQYSTETPIKVMLRSLLEDVKQDIETLRVHPDLLFTLQLLAQIESKKPKPDLDLVQEIHQTVWDGRKSKLGPTHALSLVSEFELAATFRVREDLVKAQETFERVAEERAKLLGTEHPDTLAARHEALVMNYTLGIDIDITELESILKLREWQLGRCHPEVLQSLLWLFGIQLLLGKETESETADKLLSRLREGPVQNQRLVESLRTAEKVALFYEAQGHTKRSAEVFRDILETINATGPNVNESLELSSLRIVSAKKLEEMKRTAQA